LRLALFKGPNRVGVSLHLRTETDPVSETSCFSFSSNQLESGRWTKSESPVILSFESVSRFIVCYYVHVKEVKELANDIL
jgi:hypothetical protein